jgi:D-sedoheptulose 7-phosphate isomerase
MNLRTRPKSPPEVRYVFWSRSIIRFASRAEKLYQRPSISRRSDTMYKVPQLHEAIAAAAETLQSLVDLDEQVAIAANMIEQCLGAGNKLLVCGNGGSAADAAHFATELVVRFAKDRPAQPAICLASDGGLLTAAANDYGFNEIFARQVAAFGQPGDVLVSLTTSGKSKNVERALEEAKARKLKTIALLGRDGGSTIGIADVDLLVKSDSTARIQEAHQLLLHVLCEIIESRLEL